MDLMLPTWLRRVLEPLGFDVEISGASGCCANCLADLPDHWFSDLLRYCPHRLALSQFDLSDGKWYIRRRVGPWRAWRMVARVRRAVDSEASQRGLSTVELDKLLRWGRNTTAQTQKGPGTCRRRGLGGRDG